MKNLPRDLTWTLPSALALAALLAATGPGSFWAGWLAYSALLVPGLLGLAALWRSVGASPALLVALLAGLALRLGIGVAASSVLPAAGYGSEVEEAGYLFQDAFFRDRQAWQLAASGQPLRLALGGSFASDQYGGMLFLSSLTYRLLSPDAHRPWLMILLGALTAALGAGLAYRTSRRLWGEKVALLSAWILMLYPEAVLLGAAQMREPYLITLVVMGFTGLAAWRQNRLAGLAWMLGSLAGCTLLTPLVALMLLAVIGGWVLLERLGRTAFGHPALAAGLFLLGLVVLVAGFGGWLRELANWDVYEAQVNSGWLQRIFEELPAALHLPFMTGYGLAQPVLPAAIADPAAWPWRVVGILRALGWYTLAPFLAFALGAVLRLPREENRSAWLWLWLAAWGWIVLSSYRAGGDQWDNPRYRASFLFLEALLAARAWLWWRQAGSPWPGRLLAVEAVFLTGFTYWYAARYTGWEQGQVHVFVILGVIAVLSAAILGGGALFDRLRRRRDA